MTLVVAVAAGVLVGLSLGTLGGGGSILAVPVLVHLLGQSAPQATSGSLVVVGVTALAGAVAAYRAGNVQVLRGVGFGVVAVGGAYAGAQASVLVRPAVLLAAFAGLMVVVAAVMAVRQWRARAGDGHVPGHATRPALDDPILTFSPEFACACPRALKLVVLATLVGLLTGFLGVGGGFLVVPALLLAFSMPLEEAVGTSLVVIAVTSAAALGVRAGIGATPEWGPVIVLTVASSLAAVAGARLADRLPQHRLQGGFIALVLAVGAYTGARALPDLL
ncbi:sulfite exporter TauE/SafE family protein [Nocardioides panacisoli]|uniref:sulfite exporter TauE/SafE family protein n=1 Tax=Nocardioides panacisoli TaxID=627624 RepID=UPI001C639A7A|nr:sulfite exporter TauE/SafE family protein [Nocardioides panacisoli]QYJ02792.1 sulfite exporter TauE/SafE family protein [Nocardioides panacisoli]